VFPGDLELPTDLAELRAFAEAMRARLAASEQVLEAERAAHDETREKLQTTQKSIRLTALQIEKFKVQLARLRRMKFGEPSDRLALQPDQLELTLEALEAEHAHAECVIERHMTSEEMVPIPIIDLTKSEPVEGGEMGSVRRPRRG